MFILIFNYKTRWCSLVYNLVHNSVSNYTVVESSSTLVDKLGELGCHLVGGPTSAVQESCGMEIYGAQNPILYIINMLYIIYIYNILSHIVYVYDIFSENCMCQQVPIQILTVLLSIPRNLHGFAQIHRMSHSPEANLARCMLQCTGEVGPFEGWLWFIGPESRALVAHSGWPPMIKDEHIPRLPGPSVAHPQQTKASRNS